MASTDSTSMSHNHSVLCPGIRSLVLVSPHVKGAQETPGVAHTQDNVGSSARTSSGTPAAGEACPSLSARRRNRNRTGKTLSRRSRSLAKSLNGSSGAQSPSLSHCNAHSFPKHVNRGCRTVREADATPWQQKVGPSRGQAGAPVTVTVLMGRTAGSAETATVALNVMVSVCPGSKPLRLQVAGSHSNGKPSTLKPTGTGQSVTPTLNATPPSNMIWVGWSLSMLVIRSRQIGRKSLVLVILISYSTQEPPATGRSFLSIPIGFLSLQLSRHRTCWATSTWHNGARQTRAEHGGDSTAVSACASQIIDVSTVAFAVDSFSWQSASLSESRPANASHNARLGTMISQVARADAPMASSGNVAQPSVPPGGPADGDSWQVPTVRPAASASARSFSSQISTSTSGVSPTLVTRHWYSSR